MLDNPASLLRSTIQNFEIEPDIQILNQIHKKGSQLYDSRIAKIERQQELLNEAVAKYENRLKELHTMELSSDRKEVLQQINDLNNLKFKLARNYLELETEISELKSALDKKTKEFLDLKNMSALDYEVMDNPDSTVLKLKLYKNLGLLIDIQNQKYHASNDSPKKDLGAEDDSFISKLNEDYAQNKVYKLVINNQRSNVLTTLTIDESNNHLSEYFISNYIWDNL